MLGGTTVAGDVIFMCLSILAAVGFVLAAMLTLILMMLIDETSDEDEFRQMNDRMGNNTTIHLNLFVVSLRVTF